MDNFKKTLLFVSIYGVTVLFLVALNLFVFEEIFIAKLHLDHAENHSDIVSILSEQDFFHLFDPENILSLGENLKALGLKIIF